MLKHPDRKKGLQEGAWGIFLSSPIFSVSLLPLAFGLSPQYSFTDSLVPSVVILR